MHFPSSARFLDGPKGNQRCLLSLGNTLDACDVESLVAPITPQSAQMLATREIPDGDSAIAPATGERSAIGTRLEGLDCSLVRLLPLHTLSPLDIPPAEPPVTAATDQHCAGRTPGERIHNLAQFAQGVQEFSTTSTPATTDQARPIWTPRHSTDRG
jgi:hypothetical protein